MSFHQTTEMLNRFRHQEEGGTPPRTLKDNTKKEGDAIMDEITKKTEHILLLNNFSKDGIYEGTNAEYSENKIVTILRKKIVKAAESLDNGYDIEEMLKNPVPYEDSKDAVRVSIDDVTVKKQKENREQFTVEENSGKKYVHDTIAHVTKNGKSYVLNGYSTIQVLRILIAFIFHNKLSKHRIQFFTDGHTALNDAIRKRFSWITNIGIILDWYHLVKKFKEQLSLAMKGRDLRNQILRQIMPLLWHGLTPKAIALLENLDEKGIKKQSAIEKLIGYLKRNEQSIPCYAIRKEIGLCNSSAIGEKMNDIVVSKRQKHNGMSWSKDGSVSLASITALKRNKEQQRWFEYDDLNFKLAA